MSWMTVHEAMYNVCKYLYVHRVLSEVVGWTSE